MKLRDKMKVNSPRLKGEAKFSRSGLGSGNSKGNTSFFSEK